MTARARWLTAIAILAFACSSSSNSSSSQAPDSGPATVTVKGAVVTLLLRPVAGASVLIGTASTPTDASGSFTLNDVHTPYDVSIVVGSAKVAAVFQGLTRIDPTLVIPPPDAPNRTASVMGTVSGGVTDPQIGQVAFGSRDALVNSWAGLNDWIGRPGGQFGLHPAWHGASMITGTLHVLRWTAGPANNHTQTPESFNGYLKVEPVTLSDKGTTDVGTVALTNITAKTISGTVSVPAGYVHDSRALTFLFPDGASMTMYDAYRGQLEASYSYATPADIGASIGLGIGATASTGEGLYGCTRGHAPDATGVNVTMHAAPIANVPVDGATGVDGATAFQWVPMDGAVQEVIFAPSAGTPNAASYPTFYVYTRAASVTIPNLAAVGLPMPSAIKYTWQVVGIWPYGSVDDFAVPNTPAVNPAPCGAEYQAGWTKQRSFTTK